jgi:ribosomal protein L31
MIKINSSKKLNTLIYQSVRHYKLPIRRPESFTQNVLLTDGSTITLRTTSPKGALILNKDTRNHPLWNPSLIDEDLLEKEQMNKFSEKFGNMSLDFDDLAFDESLENNNSNTLEVTQRDLQFLVTKGRTDKKKK